tara:strand:- start:993 stop:1268 length:276 start_codon:yes stop_codon:yes gene_type:complete
MSTKPVTGAFTSTAASAAITVIKEFNISLSGTWVGSVQLQRSFDEGTSWLNVGTAYTANTESVGTDPENNRVQYRFNCTWTSGTVTYRLGQ